MPVYIKISGTWYETTAQKLKSLGSVWTTTMDQIHVKIAGAWKGCLPVFGVTLQANGDSNTRPNGTCWVGIKFDSNGNEYEHTNIGGFGSAVNQWLDGGNPADAWIVFTQTAGQANFDTKTSGTRYNMATDQTFSMSVTAGAVTITGYFRAYDAASGGNLLDTSLVKTWDAEDFGI